MLGDESFQMNILFDLGHPAHVHLFRNAAKTLEDLGHNIHISIRDRKDVRDLLSLYGFDWHSASKPRTSLTGLTWELIEHDWQVFRLARKHKIDIISGTSVAASHVAKLLPNVRSAIFGEDDASVVPLYTKLTYPFADYVVVPDCISDTIKPNYVLHNSFHELAYLHPEHFTPDAEVLKQLRIRPGERYFIVRLVALKAHHDVGEKGISRALQLELIRKLESHGKVFITTEGELPSDFQAYQMKISPHMMHHAMAFSSMMITDSQTMAAESAVLGVPVFRCNTFVGRLAYLHQLESTYGLAFGYRPDDADQMMRKIEELLNLDELSIKWQEKRRIMLNEKTNFHPWMVDFFTNIGGRR